MKLAAFSDDELTEELERREKIKLGPWPKLIDLKVELCLLDDTKLNEFLAIDCGIDPDYDDSVFDTIFDDIEITIEIYQDGNGKIIKFNGIELVSEIK